MAIVEKRCSSFFIFSTVSIRSFHLFPRAHDVSAPQSTVPSVEARYVVRMPPTHSPTRRSSSCGVRKASTLDQAVPCAHRLSKLCIDMCTRLRMAAVTPTTDGRTLPVVNEKQSLKTSGLSLSGPLLGHAAEAEATATTADSSSASAASSTSAHARKSRSAKKVQQRKGSVRRIELEKRGFLKKKKKTSTGNVRGSVHTGSMRGGVRTQEKEKDLLVYAIEHVTRIYGMVSFRNRLEDTTRGQMLPWLSTLAGCE